MFLWLPLELDKSLKLRKRVNEIFHQHAMVGFPEISLDECTDKSDTYLLVIFPDIAAILKKTGSFYFFGQGSNEINNEEYFNSKSIILINFHPQSQKFSAFDILYLNKHLLIYEKSQRIKLLRHFLNYFQSEKLVL